MLTSQLGGADNVKKILRILSDSKNLQKLIEDGIAQEAKAKEALDELYQGKTAKQYSDACAVEIREKDEAVEKSAALLAESREAFAEETASKTAYLEEREAELVKTASELSEREAALTEEMAALDKREQKVAKKNAEVHALELRVEGMRDEYETKLAKVNKAIDLVR